MILMFSIFIFNLSSCSKKIPGVVFFPDMYYSIAYDPYQEATQPYINKINSVPIFRNGQTALLPVKGTIPRNIDSILPINIENTPDAYQASKKITVSPLSSKKRNLEKDLENGQKLYEQNCLSCHGSQGDGNGPIVQTGAYSGVPRYEDRDISVGSVHYVITHGKNTMGSYAFHMNSLDRWLTAEYVMYTFKQKNDN